MTSESPIQNKVERRIVFTGQEEISGFSNSLIVTTFMPNRSAPRRKHYAPQMTIETEGCAVCGQPKPIALILRNEKTGEDKPLCRICANRWLLSDEEWPPQKQDKTPIRATVKNVSQ